MGRRLRQGVKSPTISGDSVINEILATTVPAASTGQLLRAILGTAPEAHPGFSAV